MKFCKDCVHFIERLGDIQTSRCDAPQSLHWLDPVTGEPAIKFCSSQRLSNTSGKTCGPDGDWFEPHREPQAEAA